MIQSSIFKSYDIRGIYPDQINENTAYQIGRGFIKHTGAKKIFVGHDARLSSLELFRAFSEGATSQGADIYGLGLVPTEVVYFAVGTYDCDAGIMITASHNPKEYNGFKMLVRRSFSEGGMTKKDNDIIWIRGKDLFSTIESFDTTRYKNGFYEEMPHGKIYEKDVWNDYVEKIMKFSGDIKPLKIAVDASNGVAGIAVSKIKKDLPIEITEINFEPNGNFPNHSPNPLENGSINQIGKAIIENHLDFGFIFDADGDRIFLVDEAGKMVSADIVLLILAKYFLQKEAGAAIAYNAICSKAVPEFIKKWGGNPVRTAVGFVNVREGLINNNGIMGGELSAHYCFRDYFYTDSGIISFLTLLQIISAENKKLSDLARDLSPYFKSAELNFEIEDKEAILKKLKEKYADGKRDYLDGITVEYENWWFNARSSNTEPLLRLTIEADSAELLEEKKKELVDFIVGK